MAVISDIIEGCEAVIGKSGWEITRTFIVSELKAAGSAMLYEAVNTTGIPKYGDAHPAITTAYCRELRPQMLTHNSVKIVALYREYDINANYEYSVMSTAQEVETTFHFNASDESTTAISNKVVYQYPADYPNPDYRNQTARKILKSPIWIWQPVISISRFELYTIKADIQSGFNRGLLLSYVNSYEVFSMRAAHYTGHINKKNWVLNPHAPAGTWMCSGLAAVKQPDNITFKVSYEFKFNPYGWYKELAYVDPNSGEIPSDITETGKYKVRTALYADFNDLELT